MNSKSKGTFQLLLHNGESYLVMNPEGTRKYVVSHAEVLANATTILTPIGQYSDMIKARKAIDKDTEKRRVR